MPASRRKTSFVWKHFQVSDVDERKAICNNCGAAINRGRDTRTYSTSSLAAHIRFCGKTDIEKRKRPKGQNSSQNINVLLFDGESAQENPRKPQSNRHKSAGNLTQLPEDMSVSSEEYVLPGNGGDGSKDVICSKNMDLIHSGMLMNVLYQQHRSGKFCDMTLISAPQDNSSTVASTDILIASEVSEGRKVFSVHSSIFAAVSRKVKQLIEMGSRTIELKDVSAYGLSSLLEIVYTGKLKRTPTPLGYYEVNQIWKAACDLGVDYVRNYIIREHPQVSKWIQDEEKQALVEETARYVEDEEHLLQDDNSDLVDLCSSSRVETQHQEVAVLEDVQTSLHYQEEAPEIQENAAEKKTELPLVEIEFTKT